MRYYVTDTAQPNGDHEVHTSSCSFLPAETNRTYLGDFTSCSSAVSVARRIYTQCNGCFYCSRECHTG
jgi:hypothetical protein